LRPPAFREPWRFGGVQTPTLAILADLEQRIREFVPQEFFKVALPVITEAGAKLTLWHAPKDRIFDQTVAGTIRDAAATWSGSLGVEQKDVRRTPPKLFSKDTLARRCAKRFGWDPQQTAKLSQDLYDRATSATRAPNPSTCPRARPGCCRSDASISSVLADVADLAPAADKLLFRRGLKGHYVKDPGEHHAIVPLRKVPERSNVAPDLFRLGSSSPRRLSRLTCPTESTRAPRRRCKLQRRSARNALPSAAVWCACLAGARSMAVRSRRKRYRAG
jgi:DNA topoisomerase-3